MDDVDQLISKLTPEIYANLKRAIEIGKWADGRKLSQEQRETSMQAVIAYEIKHQVSESERVGYVNVQGSECHNDDGSVVEDNLDRPKPLKWK